MKPIEHSAAKEVHLADLWGYQRLNDASCHDRAARPPRVKPAQPESNLISVLPCDQRLPGAQDPSGPARYVTNKAVPVVQVNLELGVEVMHVSAPTLVVGS